MQSSYQKAMAKHNREILTKIEANLHPCPFVNGCEILHEHERGTGNIIFSAWKGLDRVNDLYLKFDRQEVLNTPDFYQAHDEDFKWLTATQEKLNIVWTSEDAIK